MSRALRGGLPRMYRRHTGARGRWFRLHYQALEARLGPFDKVTSHYAGAAAVLWCEFRQDILALESAEQLRQDGKGRRPSVQSIARLKKRAALTWGSYDAALRRLEELARNRDGHGNPLENVRRAVAAANAHKAGEL